MILLKRSNNTPKGVKWHPGSWITLVIGSFDPKRSYFRHTVQTVTNLPPGCVIRLLYIVWVQKRLNTASFYEKIKPFEDSCIHASHHVWHNRNHVYCCDENANQPWHNTTVHATAFTACRRWLIFNAVHTSAWSAKVHHNQLGLCNRVLLVF